MNLVISALGLILAVVCDVRALLIKDEDKEPNQGWLSVSVFMGISGAFLILINQEMSSPVVLVNLWTIMHATILIVEILAMNLAFKGRKAETHVHAKPPARHPPPAA